MLIIFKKLKPINVSLASGLLKSLATLAKQ